jgi:hypothetical protein
MKYLIKIGIVFVLSFILISCSTPSGMSVKTLLKMKRGMPEKAYNALLENEKMETEFTLDDIKGKNVKIKVFKKTESEIGYTFFVTFIDDMLYYWGFPYEYARHNEPLINEIGRKALSKYEFTYKRVD